MGKLLIFVILFLQVAVYGVKFSMNFEWEQFRSHTERVNAVIKKTNKTYRDGKLLYQHDILIETAEGDVKYIAYSNRPSKFKEGIPFPGFYDKSFDTFRAVGVTRHEEPWLYFHFAAFIAAFIFLMPLFVISFFVKLITSKGELKRLLDQLKARAKGKSQSIDDRKDEIDDEELMSFARESQDDEPSDSLDEEYGDRLDDDDYAA